jgi:hypothetical protein
MLYEQVSEAIFMDNDRLANVASWLLRLTGMAGSYTLQGCVSTQLNSLELQMADLSLSVGFMPSLL